MFYIYVLKSKKDNKLYTGFTTNLEARLLFHNSGRQKSTKNRTPFELIYSEKFEVKSDALKREKELKTGKGRDFLKCIVIGA